MNKEEREGHEIFGKVIRIVETIKPHLAGEGSAIQGAALADLAATWLAGHPEPMRATLLHLHLQSIGELTAIKDAENAEDSSAELPARCPTCKLRYWHGPKVCNDPWHARGGPTL